MMHFITHQTQQHQQKSKPHSTPFLPFNIINSIMLTEFTPPPSSVAPSRHPTSRTPCTPLTQQLELPNESLMVEVQPQEMVRSILEDMVGEVELRVAAGPHVGYFLKDRRMVGRLRQVNAKYHQRAQQEIEDNIWEGNITIKHTKESKFPHERVQPNPHDKIQEQRQSLRLKKEQAAHQLREIMEQQAQLMSKNASVIRMQGALQNSWSRVHSQENTHWKEDIKEALKRKKEFERGLEAKSEAHESRVMQMRSQEEKEREKRLQQERVRHHEKMEKRAQFEQQRRKQAQAKKKQSSQFVNKMKPQKYIFEKNQSLGLAEWQRQRQQLQRLMKERKEETRQEEWERVREHEEEYMQKLQQRKQEWEEAVRERLGQRVGQGHRRHRSVFSERVKKEDEVRQHELAVFERQREVLEKMKNYEQYVWEKHKPRVRKAASQQVIQTAGSPSRRESMSRSKERSKGLEYLSEAKKTAVLGKGTTTNGNIGVSTLKASTKQGSLPLLKTSYKDYLRQQPRRSDGQSVETRFSKAITGQRQGWAESACGLIGVMSSRSDKNTMDTALSKIALLNALL